MVIQLLVDDFKTSSTETFDVHVPRFIKSKLSIKIFHISEKNTPGYVDRYNKIGMFERILHYKEK